MKAVEDRSRGLGGVEIQGFPRELIAVLVRHKKNNHRLA